MAVAKLGPVEEDRVIATNLLAAKLEVDRAFARLKAETGRFTDALSKLVGRPATVFEIAPLPENSEARSVQARAGQVAVERAREIFSPTHYFADPARGDALYEAERLPGLLAADANTLAAAIALNEAKDKFEKKVKALSASANERREILASMPGMRLIHLKAAYRHIVVLRERPSRVSFSWAAGITSNEGMTRREVVELIESTGTAHTRALDHAALAQCAAQDFVRVREVALHVRANFWMLDGKRNMKHVSLPVLYPDDGEQVEIIPLQAYSRRIRARRRDAKHPLTPVLPHHAIFASENTTKAAAKDNAKTVGA